MWEPFQGFAELRARAMKLGFHGAGAHWALAEWAGVSDADFAGPNAERGLARGAVEIEWVIAQREVAAAMARDERARRHAILMLIGIVVAVIALLTATVMR